MAPERGATGLRIAIALGAVYLVWGSTYLAIRIGVETMPPFLLAAARWLAAGAILYAVARLRGAPPPTRSNWRSATVVGGFLLVGGNGFVTLAEKTIPSGLAAILVATVPLWMVLLAWARGSPRPTAGVFVGLALGLAAVAYLAAPGVAGDLDPFGALLLVAAPILWAIGSLHSKRADLPTSSLMAIASESLAGGALLLVAALATGEATSLDLATVSNASWLALAYLVVFGSIVGFTAYMWLLRHTTPAKATTYAFVNPAIAVLLGVAWGEALTVPQLAACGVIVAAVAVIVLKDARPGKNAAPPPAAPLGEAP